MWPDATDGENDDRPRMVRLCRSATNGSFPRQDSQRTEAAAVCVSGEEACGENGGDGGVPGRQLSGVAAVVAPVGTRTQTASHPQGAHRQSTPLGIDLAFAGISLQTMSGG